MSSTRDKLNQLSANLNESIGVRQGGEQVSLAPVPNNQDAGRRMLREFGRIPIDQVIPDPAQPRTEFDDEAIKQLAESIANKEQLQPIRVRRAADNDKWIIISGERRWRAAKRAGLNEIKCYFHESEMSDSEILEEQLVENIHRQSLRPVEQARAFQMLMEMNQWNGKQLADSIQVNPTLVSRSLALLKLPQEIQKLVETREISSRVGYEISKLGSVDAQLKMARDSIDGKLTVQNAARQVRKRSGKKQPLPKGTKLTLFADGEWKIQVSSRRKGTYHEVEQALAQALEEVRLRIRNNVGIYS